MKVNRHAVESESELVSLLDSLYSNSKENKPFYGLLELMTNEQTIISAIHNIKGNKGSKTVGVDDKDINYFLQMEKEDLLLVVRKAITRYEPLPVRRVYIPKKDGKLRPLGIPSMLDRIVQELARMVLDPICEAKFYKHSYGFRPYRGAEHALARMRDVVNKSGTYIAVEGDIKSFFDNINHNKLLEIMWSMGIKDKRYLSIIKKMLKAGYMDEGRLLATDEGSPQGGIISPLLANIYLNGLDWLIAKEYEYHPFTDRYKERKAAYQKMKKEGHEPTFFIRYADDWVILTKTRENAERLLLKVEKYLKCKLKLTLSREKTVITDLRKEPVRFLGYCLKVGQTRFSKCAPRLYPDMAKLTPKIREIKREIKRLRHSPNTDWLVVNGLTPELLSQAPLFSLFHCFSSSSTI
ncbi:group II intron reverse transcriptase/maturase, partial [uncultured Brevibacillus sp.]|uniref:group II intron reverse transcriptase/maturase n=1 Tax=uncultured Brevibacillus sp. TaxID=169970 RepID=UPI0025930CD3